MSVVASNIKRIRPGASHGRRSLGADMVLVSGRATVSRKAMIARSHAIDRLIFDAEGKARSNAALRSENFALRVTVLVMTVWVACATSWVAFYG